MTAPKVVCEAPLGVAQSDYSNRRSDKAAPSAMYGTMLLGATIGPVRTPMGPARRPATALEPPRIPPTDRPSSSQTFPRNQFQACVTIVRRFPSLRECRSHASGPLGAERSLGNAYGLRSRYELQLQLDGTARRRRDQSNCVGGCGPSSAYNPGNVNSRMVQRDF